jgi:hypothetical protein
MATDTPAEINEFASFSEMVEALAEKFPGGGDIQMRLDNGWNDEPAYLFIEQVCPTEDEDLWHEDGEDVLGQDLYEKVDSTVNGLMAENALPGYASGEKFFAIEWKPATGK